VGIRFSSDRTRIVDANKLQKLREIGFQVNKSCGLCRNFKSYGWGVFGTCGIYTYEHQKHKVKTRKLSVPIYGLCGEFAISVRATETLHKFAELMEGPKRCSACGSMSDTLEGWVKECDECSEGPYW